MPAETKQNFQYLQHAITIIIGKQAVEIFEVNHIFVSSNTRMLMKKQCAWHIEKSSCRFGTILALETTIPPLQQQISNSHFLLQTSAMK